MFTFVEITKLRELVEECEAMLRYFDLMYAIDNISGRDNRDIVPTQLYQRYHSMKNLVKWCRNRVISPYPGEDCRKSKASFTGKERRA